MLKTHRLKMSNGRGLALGFVLVLILVASLAAGFFFRKSLTGGEVARDFSTRQGLEHVMDGQLARARRAVADQVAGVAVMGSNMALQIPLATIQNTLDADRVTLKGLLCLYEGANRAACTRGLDPARFPKVFELAMSAVDGASGALVTTTQVFMVSRAEMNISEFGFVLSNATQDMNFLNAVFNSPVALFFQNPSTSLARFRGRNAFNSELITNFPNEYRMLIEPGINNQAGALSLAKGARFNAPSGFQSELSVSDARLDQMANDPTSPHKMPFDYVRERNQFVQEALSGCSQNPDNCESDNSVKPTIQLSANPNDCQLSFELEVTVVCTDEPCGPGIQRGADVVVRRPIWQGRQTNTVWWTQDPLFVKSDRGNTGYLCERQTFSSAADVKIGSSLERAPGYSPAQANSAVVGSSVSLDYNVRLKDNHAVLDRHYGLNGAPSDYQSSAGSHSLVLETSLVALNGSALSLDGHFFRTHQNQVMNLGAMRVEGLVVSQNPSVLNATFGNQVGGFRGSSFTAGQSLAANPPPGLNFNIAVGFVDSVISTSSTWNEIASALQELQ